METKLVGIRAANDGKHKFTATLLVGRRLRQVHFGAHGSKDYTVYFKERGKAEADKRRRLYLARHSRMGEDWSNPQTAGFFARWILWEKPTVEGAIRNLIVQFPSIAGGL
ncbi:MAG: hypothetical protein EBW68_01410 [Actinobacteria bacterium]|nr:hypothetical protein [Actinomycetota bacterium]